MRITTLYRELAACGHQASLYSFKRQYPRRLFPGLTDHDPSQLNLNQIACLGIKQNIVIVDQYVPNEQVLLYFSAADVVVLPYTDVTQSGVVQLAFGFGVPVITTRVGGLPEVVADSETGFLVEPGDVSGLSRAIVRFFAKTGQYLSALLSNKAGHSLDGGGIDTTLKLIKVKEWQQCRT